MKEFASFLATNAVRRQQPDVHTATATARDSADRLALAGRLLGKEAPKYVVENAYESVRELVDALLFLRGYKSYSHEATVAYLLVLGLPLSDAGALDRLRKHRNGIKYYGEAATEQQAQEALRVAGQLTRKLRKREPALAQAAESTVP